MIGERPIADRLTREVARAASAAALFADGARVQLGRYALIERAGAGGMGIVWSAWDPDLERHVAIKVVRAEVEAARDRILAEGKALAKLSHPHVVPIFDVGVVDDQVYLVMEWVRGETLRAYCSRAPRTARAIVATYRAAGTGLLAAHRAGLVHRDFKPDNVMIGDDDGRARVLDFGLATPEAAAAGRAGTPRYMAPEQVRGEAVTAAADQYAFCVALREALAARGAIPPWLVAIAARGTREDPAQRYPSMAELLRALARDPARVWRRRGVAGGALALAAAGAFAIGAARSDEPADPCSAPELTWSAAARDGLRTHLQALGPYGADEATRFDADLARYRDRWETTRHAACVARAAVPAPVYEREVVCLARARAAFDVVVEVAARVPADRLADAVVAERDLAPVERCTTDAVASTIAPPAPAFAAEVERTETQLARARYLSLARDPAAPDVATRAAAVADRLGYAPLVARAQLERGAALANEPTTASEAIAAYERATAAALEAGDDITFVEAFARALFALPQVTPRPDHLANTPAAIPFAQQIARRTGAAGAFARALLANNAGTERLASGDLAGARTWFAQAIAEQRAGARGIELWTSYGNLAIATEDPAARDRLFGEERVELERRLGPHHAFTLEARLRGALFVEDDDRARRELADICDALRTWQPERRTLVEQCGYELGWLAADARDPAAARAAYALATTGDAPTAELARLAIARANGEDIAARAEAAAARFAADPAWWIRFSAVDAELLVGTKPARQRAVALLADPAFNHAATYYRRRLARAAR